MPLLAALMPLLSGILNLIPNPAERQAKLMEIVTALQQWDSQQTQIDTAEANNQNLFVSGWRPFIGWVCALAVAYQYLIIPFATWGFAVAHATMPAFPKLDDQLWQLMFGMLGMSGLRTVEKMKGLTK